MAEFILYSYFRSSASYRVRIALHLKKIEFEYRAVHLLNKDQQSKSYVELNPSGQVPTLIHNGHTLGQSMAIVEYLDLIKPTPALFPSDPAKRALVVQACEIVNSGAQPLHNLRVLQELEARFNADQDAKNAWSAFWIRNGLEALESLLKKHSGKFCFADTVTAADCFVIPHLANADRYKVSLQDFPILTRIRANCESIEAFKKSAPGVQPDTPANG